MRYDTNEADGRSRAHSVPSTLPIPTSAQHREDKHLRESKDDHPRRKIPWGLRDMLVAAAVAIGMTAVSVGLTIGGARIWASAGLPTIPQGYRVLLVFALEVVFIIPAWRWGPGKYGGGWESLGLRQTRLVKSGLLFVLGFLCAFTASLVGDSIRRHLGLARQPSSLSIYGEGLQGLALALIVGSFVAPVAEEIFFRGYLYAGLRQRWGVGWAMIVSSLLFSLVHFTPAVVVPVFLGGLFFAYVFERTGSVLPCIALHGAMNASAFAGLYLIGRYPQLLGSL